MPMMLNWRGPDARGPTADAHDAWCERLMLMMLGCSCCLRREGQQLMLLMLGLWQA